MKTCDHCGQPARTVYPVMRKPPAAVAEVGDRPLSRLALYALGVPEPAWGQHPDDDRFETWCENCYRELAGSEVTKERSHPNGT